MRGDLGWCVSAAGRKLKIPLQHFHMHIANASQEPSELSTCVCLYQHRLSNKLAKESRDRKSTWQQQPILIYVHSSSLLNKPKQWRAWSQL